MQPSIPCSENVTDVHTKQAKGMAFKPQGSGWIPASALMPIITALPLEGHIVIEIIRQMHRCLSESKRNTQYSGDLQYQILK